MFVELDIRHDARYTVSLEWDGNTGETQIVVGDSGTSSLLVKFIPPETLERFGGADAFAKAVDSSVDRLAAALHDRAALSMLLLRERRAKPPAGNG